MITKIHDEKKKKYFLKIQKFKKKKKTCNSILAHRFRTKAHSSIRACHILLQWHHLGSWNHHHYCEWTEHDHPTNSSFHFLTPPADSRDQTEAAPHDPLPKLRRGKLESFSVLKFPDRLPIGQWHYQLD